MCWLFAISSLGCLRIGLLRILRIVLRHNAARSFNLLFATAFFVAAIIFALAWWTIWKERPSAKAWGIAASLIFILLPIGSAVYFSRSILGPFGVMLATGVVALVAFLWRAEPHGATENL